MIITQQTIVKTLNECLLRGEHQGFETFAFVMDYNVEYNKRNVAQVCAEHLLISQDEVDHAIDSLLEGGPVWLHANGIATSEDEKYEIIISLLAGKPEGAKFTRLNSSYEIHRTVRIIGSRHRRS